MNYASMEPHGASCVVDSASGFAPHRLARFAPRQAAHPRGAFYVRSSAIDQKKAFAVRGLLKRLEDARCYARSDKLNDGGFSLPMPTGN
jgi:hypothetical protein